MEISLSSLKPKQARLKFKANNKKSKDSLDFKTCFTRKYDLINFTFIFDVLHCNIKNISILLFSQVKEYEMNVA